MTLSNVYNHLYWMLFFATTAYSARILGIYPIKAKSHFGYQEAIFESLLAAGHHVTVISPFVPRSTSKNMTHINSRVHSMEEENPFAVYDFKMFSMVDIYEFFLTNSEEDCYALANRKEIKDLLHSNENKYDIIFIEILLMHQCFYPIAKKLGIPIIGTIPLVSWASLDMELGMIRNPAVIPSDIDFIPKTMTFYQRLINTINYIIFNFFIKPQELIKVKKFYERYYPQYDYRDQEIALAFSNSHPVIFPRNVPPNFIEIGGIHIKPKTEPLSETLKKFIEEADHGVILFSIGTVSTSNSIDPELRQVFRETFAKIPQRVIWKFEEDVDCLSENVLITRWVPQQAILAHENVKVFITHCGIHSTYESIYNAKPMVLIPVFGDQKTISAFLNELGVGVLVDIFTLTSEKLLSSLDSVVNDTSYRENVQRISKAFKDRPTSPQKAVVYWTEYVLRHNGTAHLRTVDSTMPLYQYFMLDVIVFVVAIISVISYFLYLLVKSVYVFFLIKPKSEISRKFTTKKIE